ncbi:hypothetical protein CPB85DRAFT_1258385 [Mucidula mucida]|nr:hypothetical protein CPB85DRAFT_1258385 [Mucidula mucida]
MFGSPHLGKAGVLLSAVVDIFEIAMSLNGGTLTRRLVGCIPVKGQSNGEDVEEPLTFQEFIAEFQDIVRSSDETTNVVVYIRNDDEEARKKRWKDCGPLRRMRWTFEEARKAGATNGKQRCWSSLGLKPTIFTLPSMKLRTCVQVFDKAFKRGLPLQVKKTIQQAIRHRKLASDQQMPNRVTLDSAPMRVFLDDEELEDLIDIARVVVDLRAALEEHADRMKRRRAEVPEDDHVFLVSVKDIQCLPWENIPILRGRGLSRIVGVEFLLDRVQFARWRKSASHDRYRGRVTISLTRAASWDEQRNISRVVPNIWSLLVDRELAGTLQTSIPECATEYVTISLYLVMVATSNTISDETCGGHAAGCFLGFFVRWVTLTEFVGMRINKNEDSENTKLSIRGQS